MDIKQDACIIGVSITPLTIIEDERGAVMHMMRSDSVGFQQFGEVYFSLVKSCVIKGWKRHTRMTQNITVPQGKIKLVIFDCREHSETHGQVQTILLGRLSNYCRVTIPPGVWYAFQGVSLTEAMLCNCADMPHDPNESVVMDLNELEVDYEW